MKQRDIGAFCRLQSVCVIKLHSRLNKEQTAIVSENVDCREFIGLIIYRKKYVEKRTFNEFKIQSLKSN